MKEGLENFAENKTPNKSRFFGRAARVVQSLLLASTLFGCAQSNETPANGNSSTQTPQSQELPTFVPEPSPITPELEVEKDRLNLEEALATDAKVIHLFIFPACGKENIDDLDQLSEFIQDKIINSGKNISPDSVYRDSKNGAEYKYINASLERFQQELIESKSIPNESARKSAIDNISKIIADGDIFSIPLSEGDEQSQVSLHIYQNFDSVPPRSEKPFYERGELTVWGAQSFGGEQGCIEIPPSEKVD